MNLFCSAHNIHFSVWFLNCHIGFNCKFIIGASGEVDSCSVMCVGPYIGASKLQSGNWMSSYKFYHIFCFSSSDGECGTEYFQMASCGQDYEIRLWLISYSDERGNCVIFQYTICVCGAHTNMSGQQSC